MPTYVQIVTFQGRRYDFDENEDTKRINEVMKKLQDRKAKILDIKVGQSGGVPIYIITYEADNPLEV